MPLRASPWCAKEWPAPSQESASDLPTAAGVRHGGKERAQKFANKLGTAPGFALGHEPGRAKTPSLPVGAPILDGLTPRQTAGSSFPAWTRTFNQGTTAQRLCPATPRRKRPKGLYEFAGVGIERALRDWGERSSLLKRRSSPSATGKAAALRPEALRRSARSAEAGLARLLAKRLIGCLRHPRCMAAHLSLWRASGMDPHRYGNLRASFFGPCKTWPRVGQGLPRLASLGGVVCGGV